MSRRLARALRELAFPEGAVGQPWTPYLADERAYAIPKHPGPAETVAGSSLPVPPSKLRLHYGTTPEHYHRSGVRDVAAMREILERGGLPIASAGRILDLGCAAGRMIRALEDLAPTNEIWGVDTTASRIAWCKEHLCPPFHFATTTIVPHLPFEDRSFGLVYAGSVFTHIDDLAEAWFQELRRVLRPGGALYVTIADRHTLSLLEGPKRDHWLAQMLRAAPEYAEIARTDFGMFTIADSTERPRAAACEVVYDADYLRARLEPYFRVVSVNEEAYGYQTAFLLERR